MQLYSEQSFFNSPLFSPPSSVFFSISSLQTFGLTDRLLGRRAHRARSHHVIHTHTHCPPEQPGPQYSQMWSEEALTDTRTHAHPHTQGDGVSGLEDSGSGLGGLMKMRWDTDTGPLHRSLVSTPLSLGACVREGIRSDLN